MNQQRPKNEEATRSFAGRSVASRMRTARYYGNATLQATARSYLIDCDGATRAKKLGFCPNSVCIAIGIPWGFPQSAWLVVAPNGNPWALDFSACTGVDVIVRFDNDTHFGWLTSLVQAVVRSNPQRLQLWNLEAWDDKAGIFFLKLGGQSESAY